MTRISSCQLVDMLAEVPDPRKKKGLRHPLASMLSRLSVCCVVNAAIHRLPNGHVSTLPFETPWGSRRNKPLRPQRISIMTSPP